MPHKQRVAAVTPVQEAALRLSTRVHCVISQAAHIKHDQLYKHTPCSVLPEQSVRKAQTLLQAQTNGKGLC
jgi:hypothetical protein